MPLATLKFRLALSAIAGTTPGMVLFIPAVILSGYFGGIGPGLLSTVTAGLLTDYFLLPPYGSLVIANPFNLVQWLTMLAIGVLASVAMHLLQLARRRAERTAAASFKLLDSLRQRIAKSPNVIALFDRDLDYLAASVRWVADYCSSGADPVGRNLYEESPQMPESWKALHQAALRGEPFQGSELEWLLPDGKTIWISAAVSPWTDVNGDIGGIIISLEDVTVRHRLQEELRRARALADETNRAKTALLASVSHELRTPLNGIIGFSEALLGEIFGAFAHPRQREYVEDIRIAGLHLLDLISDILDTSALLARETTLEEMPLDMAAVIATACRFVKPLAEKGEVTLTASCSGDLPCVIGEQRRITQILLNLLSNAIKFTEPGGSVTVAAGLTDSGEFEVTVRDTGVGMTPEQLDSARLPFAPQQNSFVQSRKGAGLGLYLAEGLMAVHDGSMRIESTPGVGTTVTITFPAHRLKQTAPAATPL
jgi:PAS domain S-box-containing protein